MATQQKIEEKVDVVIAGAGASGSTFAAVLAKAGKKVVLIDNGPDWQASDLISSDMWGRRIKPAGPHLHSRRQTSGADRAITAAGASAARRAALVCQRAASSPKRLSRSRASTTAPTIGRSLMKMWRRGTTRSRTTSESPATPRPRKLWRPKRARLSDAADEDLQERRGCGRRDLPPTTFAWCRPRSP